MRARLIRRRDALGRAAAVETRAIQVALPGVVGRGAEIHPARLLVEAGDVGHVGVELGDQLPVAALARHAIDVLPAVALAQPQEGAAAIDPRHFLDDVDPRLRFVAEHALHRAGLDVGGQEVVAVLLAIELLDRDGVRIDPADAREIGVARIALGLDPRRRAALGADHADARRRVRRAGLRIRNLRDHRIQRVGVVDQREDADAGAVELPVDDRLAVGTEAEAVANAELLLVDPVRRAVDDRFRSVGRQLRDLAVVEALDVDVVAAHVADARRIRRELREHQRRRRMRRADLLERRRS